MSVWCEVLLFQMVHIFASETDHFPPIKALFELVTSVTLSIFQQGRGSSRGGTVNIVKCVCSNQWCTFVCFTRSKKWKEWNCKHIFLLNNRKQLVKNVAHYGVMVPFPAAMELEDWYVVAFLDNKTARPQIGKWLKVRGHLTLLSHSTFKRLLPLLINASGSTKWSLLDVLK